MRPTALAPLLVLATLLGGCGAGDDRSAARTVTERFYAAVRAQDGAGACALLSKSALEELETQSGQSCEDVITRLRYEGGAIAAVGVFAVNAKVDLVSGESAFLSREPDGWRLSAVGCKPEEGKPADRPFECEIAA